MIADRRIGPRNQGVVNMKGDNETLLPGATTVDGGTKAVSRVALSAIGVVAFATLTALGARFVIHIGPVPMTLQVFFVLLAGMTMGKRLGVASQIAYVTAGLLGVPVFSSPPHAGPGYLLGPTGGYLVGFVAAAYFTGLVVEKLGGSFKKGPSIFAYLLAGTVGLVLIYALGAGWLAVFMMHDGLKFSTALGNAVSAGIAPFVVVDLLKCAAAALVVEGAGALKNRRQMRVDS